MPISLSPETESLLKKRAKEEGSSEDALADAILYGVLAEEIARRQNDAEAVGEAVRQEAEGRYRPFAEYVAEHQARYGTRSE